VAVGIFDLARELEAMEAARGRTMTSKGRDFEASIEDIIDQRILPKELACFRRGGGGAKEGEQGGGAGGNGGDYGDLRKWGKLLVFKPYIYV
jgi:hypothetical protein